MYFPTLIREDETQQSRLEKRSNRDTAIKILQIAQREHYMAKLEKEEEQRRKSEKVMKSLERIRRKKEVMLMTEEVLRQMEQIRIEKEVGIVVHEKMVAIRTAVC